MKKVRSHAIAQTRRPDRKRAQLAIADFLAAIGFDVKDEPELRGTPKRVASAFIDELLGGYSFDPHDELTSNLSARKDDDDQAVVAVCDVPVVIVCPHHLTLGQGLAHVAYAPGKSLVGLGSLVKVVQGRSRRLALQESVAKQVCDDLVESAGARGAACEISLDAQCVTCRGERTSGARAVCFATAGKIDSATVRGLFEASASSVSRDQ